MQRYCRTTRRFGGSSAAPVRHVDTATMTTRADDDHLQTDPGDPMITRPKQLLRLLFTTLVLLALPAVPARALRATTPPGEVSYLTTPQIPDFRFQVTIDGDVQGHRETSCIDETLCVSGALPGRSELFLRVIGPRPNGYLWVQLVRFTSSEIDVSVTQVSTGVRRTYHLDALAPNSEALRGLIDKEAFSPTGRGPGRRSALETQAYAAAPLDTTAARPEPVTFRPPEFPDFRFTVRIFSGSEEVTAHRETRCLPETACVSGALPGRSELFLRIIGPRPNGFLHVNLVRFSPSRIEVVIDRLSTGERQRYVLPALPPSDTELSGRLDRHAFAAGDGGLVPDPGPANDRTLAGIDSNNDGVRDDVERLIEINFSGRPDSISALRQGARAMQRALVDTGAQRAAVGDAEDSARALECLMAVRPSDGSRYFLELVAEMVDTDLRLNTYLALNEQLSGLAFTSEAPDRWLSSCSFTPTNASLRQRKAEAEAAPSCGTALTTLFYVNGVRNDYFMAMASESELAHLVSTRYPALRSTVTFKLSYNQTHGLFDLIEALQQISPGSPSTLLRIVFGLINPRVGRAGEILGKFAEIAAEVVQSQKLQRFVEMYRTELNVGKKVVLVAHSQGNLYANRAYDLLRPQYGQNLGIVSVATPDTRVAGGGPWFTLTGDTVINRVRQFLSSATLPADFEGPLPGADSWMHGFLESYLQVGGTTRGPILTGIDQRIDALEPPQGIAHDGVITATLTWGSEPDVDLHVFEPGGRHVYYGARQGDAGYLDLDDTSSYGPEHYYVSCDTLVPGTYRIGVNYYFGFSPETALVEIKAGLLNRPYTISLPVSRGSAGDSSPIPVARIVVTRAASGEYEFQVLSGW